MDMRETILKAVEIKAGDNTLSDLVPSEVSPEMLEAISEALEVKREAGEYLLLVTKPTGQWPEPQGMSIVYGDTMGLIFDSSSGMGSSAYVRGFSRGVATVASILDLDSLVKLQHIITQVMEPIAIGDAPLPEVAPWLRRPLLESAVNIVEKTDNYNLRDVLAYNYGLFWATAAIVPPEPKGRQANALQWVKNVAEYFGSLGVVPE